MRTRLPGIFGLVASLLGLFFSGFSTYDYAKHLDRQLHATHCSFIPGLAAEETGANACKAAMYSTYSALFRDQFWGGVPISLFALGAYAFFLGISLHLLLGGNNASKRAWQAFGLASITPLFASAIMFFISLTKLGQFCKLCVGLYVSSILLATAGIIALVRAGGKAVPASPYAPGIPADQTIPDPGPPAFAQATPPGYPQHAYAMPAPGAPPPGGGIATAPVPPGSFFAFPAAFALLGLASALPALVYVSSLPDYKPHLTSCGKILEPVEKTGALVKIQTARPVQPALTFEDPLCPTCKAFHQRLITEEIYDRLDMTVAIFPLDNECNWMIDRPLHPGSCQVAKAFLCGDKSGQSRQILDWAYANQDDLVAAGKAGKDVIRGKIRARFPDLDACIDDKETKKRLDRILHFAVANKIPLSTPQMFLGETRLCEEDTDLGMRYVVGQLAPQVFQP